MVYTVHFMLLYLIDMQGCILDCAEMMDVVLKKGSWYSYGDHRFVFCNMFGSFLENIKHCSCGLYQHLVLPLEMVKLRSTCVVTQCCTF